ncbi:MAG TPA: CHY zinc finger protein [Terriglobales bacterium]|jgi:uncharacterized CHY-type Zn-finger protein
MPAHPKVLGIDIDPQTRCKHYRSPLDVIAIKMKCCGKYYACKDCHEELANHTIEVWPKNLWSEKAVLCGVCGIELTIERYLASENQCPSCKASFNPGCKNHYHFYFSDR